MKGYGRTLIAIILTITLFLFLNSKDVEKETAELTVAIVGLVSLILNFFNMDKGKKIKEEIEKHEKLLQSSYEVKKEKELLMTNLHNGINDIETAIKRYQAIAHIDISESKEVKNEKIVLNHSVIDNLQTIYNSINFYSLVIDRELVLLGQEIKGIVSSKNSISLSEIHTINENINNIKIRLKTLK